MRSIILKWLRGATIVAAVAYFAMLLYWLEPYIKERFLRSPTREDPSTVATWPEAAALRDRLRARRPEDWQHIKQLTLDGGHPLTPLVKEVFLVQAWSPQGQKPLTIEHRMVGLGIRGDRLIWAMAILAGLVLLAWDLWKEPARLESRAGLESSDIDLPKLLRAEVRHCEDMCKRAYARSTYLLRGAIFATLGGVGALFSLPTGVDELQKVTSSDELWLLLTRPYGIVLLANAVALLFLRQYRFSAEDYRYMVNLRWRRVNALAASLEGAGAKAEQVTKALLSEVYPEERLRRDGSGLAKKGEEEDERTGGFLNTVKEALKPGEK